jgi:hypothetical protein
VPRGRGGSSCVRFCRSLRWSLNSHVGFGIGGSRDTRTGAGAGAHSPDTSDPRTRTRASRPVRVPDPLGPADDTHTCGLVRFMFDSSHIGLSGRLPRWAVGARASHSEGAGRRAKAILVTSAAAVFVRGCRRAGPPAPRATSRPCACRARGRCECHWLWLSSGWLRRIRSHESRWYTVKDALEGSQLTQ